MGHDQGPVDAVDESLGRWASVEMRGHTQGDATEECDVQERGEGDNYAASAPVLCPLLKQATEGE